MARALRQLHHLSLTLGGALIQVLVCRWEQLRLLQLCMLVLSKRLLQLLSGVQVLLLGLIRWGSTIIIIVITAIHVA